MKDCPKLPMLYFGIKESPASPDLASPIKKFIREYYGDDGELYNKEIKELENLRNAALRSSHDMNGCLTLKRYYAQLFTFNNKVKIMKGTFDGKFTWKDIYTGHSVTGDIQFELDCILYNIGALHAELGAQGMRDNAENLRIACTHFQCAVWAFEQLKDHPQNHKSKDMSHDIISFIYQTMLAQAQECFLEKSMLDNRKSSIVAKVAAQVIEYYNNALIVLIQASLNADVNMITDIVGSGIFKDWKRFTEFKISYYTAVCAYYMGQFCEEQQKTGERIAWYLSGEDHLKQAEKLAKSVDRPEIPDALNYLTDTLVKKRESAERENDFVYHQAVPTSDKLTAVKGAALVSGVSFNVSDPEVCGKDIFARLVPIEAHELASIYSENKDSIMRRMRAKVEEKDEELARYLSSLQLDKETLKPVFNTVPDELIEICAELSVKPNICKDVRNQLQSLEELAREVSKHIDEAETLIREDEEKEKKHQEKFGKRAPSMIIVELTKELRKHEETHKRGLSSNANLSQALEKYSKDIQLLSECSAKDLEGLLPPFTDIPFDEANIKEIEKLLDKVQEMRDQRASLEKQLREAIQQDDVLKHVIAHSKNEIEEIFAKEIKKYDNTVNLLQQNMAAQDNILNALTKASASYGKARMALNEVNRLRESRIQSLMHSFESFMQVKDNIEKGIEFYKELASVTGKLLGRLKSVIKVQDEERLQVVEVQIKKETGNFSNLSLVNKRPMPEPTGAPKLKDYLPYMSYRNSPISSPPVIPPQAPQTMPQYTPFPTQTSMATTGHSQSTINTFYQNGCQYETPPASSITNEQNNYTQQAITSVNTNANPAQRGTPYDPYIGQVTIPQSYPQNPPPISNYMAQHPQLHSRENPQALPSQPAQLPIQAPSQTEAQIQPQIPSTQQYLGSQVGSVNNTVQQLPSHQQTYPGQPNIPPAVNSYSEYYYPSNPGYFTQQHPAQLQPQTQQQPQHPSQAQVQQPTGYNQYQHLEYQGQNYAQQTYQNYPSPVQSTPGYQNIQYTSQHQQQPHHLQQMTSVSTASTFTPVSSQSYSYDRNYQQQVYNYNNQATTDQVIGVDTAYNPATCQNNVSLDKNVPLNPVPVMSPKQIESESSVNSATITKPDTSVKQNNQNLTKETQQQDGPGREGNHDVPDNASKDILCQFDPLWA